jgi:hypothetical protein
MENGNKIPRRHKHLVLGVISGACVHLNALSRQESGQFLWAISLPCLHPDLRTSNGRATDNDRGLIKILSRQMSLEGLRKTMKDTSPDTRCLVRPRFEPSVSGI